MRVAQPAVDLSVSGGALVAFGGQTLVSGAAPSLGLSASVTPSGLGQRVRGVASLALAPEPDASAAVALALAAEVPLSGGRNGVYLTLGGAFLSVDGVDVDACRRDPNCFYEGGGVRSHTGLAWTGGVGARVPIGKLWIEPAASAYVWGDVLPSARLGVGWRLR